MKSLLLAICLSFCFQSFAKTAYVDISSVFLQSRQAKKIKTKLEKEKRSAEKRFKKIRASLQKSEQEFKKEAAILSEQARAKKIQALQEKFLTFQKQTKNKELELQNLQAKLTSPVIQKIKKIVSSVAKKQKYLVVKNIGNDVLWVDPSINITKKITSTFNKKYR